jgi:hypothetical protein
LSSKFNRSALLSLIPIIVGVLILFGPIIFTGRALFWGAPSLQFVPWWARAWENIQEGLLPLWNPDVGMGAPLLANYQLAFFYPPNWLYLLSALLNGVVGIAWTQALITAIHISWAGLGMFVLARELNFSKLGQMVSSLSFAFSGYLVARAWFLSINAAVAWLPWILYAAYRLVHDLTPLNTQFNLTSVKKIFKLLSFWLLALFVGLQLLAGHAQTAWYTLVITLCWVLFWSLAPDKNHIAAALPTDGISTQTPRTKPILWVIPVVGAALAIGFALAAIQLLPTGEYLFQSQRASQVDFELAMTYSFWPWRFLGFIAPNAFGNPAFGNYWGYANFWEDAIYIGLIPFFLAFSALLSQHDRSRKPFKWFLMVVILISFLFALGKNTPVFPFLYRYIPTFDMFQAPTRWSILAVFAICLLAGMGADTWRRPVKKSLYWTRLGTAGAFAIAFGAALAWILLRGQADVVRLQTLVLAFGLAGLWMLGGGILTLSAPLSSASRPQMGLWAWLAVAWIALDLVVAGWGLNPGTSLDIYRQTGLTEDDMSTPRIFMPADSETELKYQNLFRFDTFHAVQDWSILRETYLADINILDHVRTVNNFDPLLADRTVNWINLLDSISNSELPSLLNLSNVSVVVKKDLIKAGGVDLQSIDPGAYLRWYSCAETQENGQAVLDAIKRDPEQAKQTLFLEAGEVDATPKCLEPEQVNFLQEKNTAQSKIIQIEATQPGWLVMSETWYPGWRAELDGRQVDILRANYQFQAVAIPEGSHKLKIIYDPGSIKIGSLISFAALLLILAAVMMIRKYKT